MGAFGRLLESYFGGTIHDVKTWGNSTPNIKQNKMENNNQEYVSLFNYLKKPAGVLGQEVYAAAKKAGEKVCTEDISTPKFTGKVMTYRREFLDNFFQTKENNDKPF